MRLVSEGVSTITHLRIDHAGTWLLLSGFYCRNPSDSRQSTVFAIVQEAKGCVKRSLFRSIRGLDYSIGSDHLTDEILGRFGPLWCDLEYGPALEQAE